MQEPFEGISLNVALLFCRGILNERAFPLRSHDPSLRETLFIQFLHEPWLDLIHRQGLNWEVFLLIFFPLSLIWSLLHSFAISTRNKLPLRSDSSYKRWVPLSSSSFKVPISSKFLFSHLILRFMQWASAKKIFDLDKKRFCYECLKT